jgi:hypothetical protein
MNIKIKDKFVLKILQQTSKSIICYGKQQTKKSSKYMYSRRDNAGKSWGGSDEQKADAFV